MLSFTRVLVAFHAGVYLALVGLTPSSSLALATPFSTVSKNHSASVHDQAGPRSKMLKTSSPSTRSTEPRQQDSIVDVLSSLNTHSNELVQCGKSCPGAPTSQQQPSAASLSSFCESLVLLQAHVGDKGLAYYNKNSDLEISVRQLVDAIKAVLGASYTLIQCNRVLGPILGPSIYAIKCFIEWLLDFSEDLTDETINILEALLGQCGNCNGLVCDLGL